MLIVFVIDVVSTCNVASVEGEWHQASDVQRQDDVTRRTCVETDLAALLEQQMNICQSKITDLTLSLFVKFINT